MKIILHTNVLIEGIFFSGPSYQILKAWRDGKLQLAISQEMLEEYRKAGEALAEQFPAVDLQPVLDMVQDKAEMFFVQCLLAPMCDDPEDDKFLACALTGKSKVIVSEDQHLLNISGFGKVEVLLPREFVDIYLKPARHTTV